MLRTVLSLLIFLIVAVWLGIQLSQDPGQAFFSWHDTSVEMPLWFALVSLLFILFFTWQAARLFCALPHTLYRLKNWRHERQTHQSHKKLSDGLLNLLTLRFQKAERQLNAAADLSDLRPIRYLSLAYTAHRLRDIKQRDAALALAGDTLPTRLLQADFLLDERRPDQVILLLEPHRKEPAALLRLQKAYRRLEQWESLILLIPLLRKAKLLNDEKATHLELKTARAWLATTDTAEKLQTLWQRFPRALQKNSRLVRTYAMQLMHHQASPVVIASVITRALSRDFNSGLVRLYGKLESTDPKKQLALAEKWLKTHPGNPALLLTLGQFAIRCRLWGKARGYLNDCLELGGKEPGAHTLLGWLDEQAGDHRGALIQYREGLLGITEKNEAEV